MFRLGLKLLLIVAVAMASKTAVLKAIVDKTVKVIDVAELNLPLIQHNSINVGTNSFTDNSSNIAILMETDRGASEILHQKFTMQWVPSGNNTEIEFKGLTGTLTGQQGKPGVVFNPQDNTLSVNLLLSRPDGTFSIATTSTLCMLVSPPTEDSLPNPDKLVFAKFTNGVRLPQGWWHSVPFPVPGEALIELDEIVAASNENNVINVAEEAGAPMVVKV